MVCKSRDYYHCNLFGGRILRSPASGYGSREREGPNCVFRSFGHDARRQFDDDSEWRKLFLAASTLANMRNRATTPLSKAVCFNCFPNSKFWWGNCVAWANAGYLSPSARKSDNHGANITCITSAASRIPRSRTRPSSSRNGPPSPWPVPTTANRSVRVNGSACSRGAYGVWCP